MKTTIEISDPLMRQARKLASQKGITLRALIEQSLRAAIAEKKQANGFQLRRATFKGEGLRPEIRDAGWERLREMAYESHGG
ncbi:MAG: type II toxin-antitoxin system VapB family antitoxin [Rhodocyclaceae bacterium]|nr:type II toxin-antitoxin system VapB family antitoxin [Rhodocyclaceae bacterium]